MVLPKKAVILPKKIEDSNDSSSSSREEDSDDSDDGEEVLVNPAEVIKSEFLDELIIRLMLAKKGKNTSGVKTTGKKKKKVMPLVDVQIDLTSLFRLCDMAIESFRRQSSLLTINKATLPLTVCADIHGQFYDLRNIFRRCGPPQAHSYLFLGDYVDRGVQGIEVMTLLLALKVKYPTKVFMLRGNHEDANTCASYGFFDECVNRFMVPGGSGEKLWNKFIQVFNWIPLAAVVNQRILCMHGGISPSLDSLQSIAKIQRPAIIPPYGLMCDLVWSDPDEKLKGWSMSSRGISLGFSSDVVEGLCKRLKIDLIVRGHQLTKDMTQNGYRFFFKGRLLTIFSAPNYLNMRNSAAVLRISKHMKCRLMVFRGQKKKLGKK